MFKLLEQARGRIRLKRYRVGQNKLIVTGSRRSSLMFPHSTSYLSTYQTNYSSKAPRRAVPDARA